MTTSTMPKHEAILASAGSGKTHALVTRYLRLLAATQAPERIVALTFTRKAAGEFFDKILRRLADAARDTKARRELAESLGRDDLGEAEVIGWLRTVIDRLPFLRLGTLDSFFIRMVSAFPLEFGLGGPFALLEGADIARERDELCRRIFRAAPDEHGGDQDAFLEAFDGATFGIEEKSLHRAFDAFIKDHHLAWLLDPDLEKWGHAARVWPEIPWYFQHAHEDPVALCNDFEEAIGSMVLKPYQSGKLREIATILLEHQEGTSTSKKFDYLRSNVLPALDGMRQGSATIKIRSSLDLSEQVCRALSALIGRMLALEATMTLQRTMGLAAVLEDYEAHHESAVRREGRLTFDDVKWLLARGGPAATQGNGGAAPARLAIDERLDARFDHWLIDEFQDTSLLQWEVLRPLVEEALQDPEGERTYFQVGDEKQSVYRWRGGEPELGRHIIERYGLSVRALAQSWRSAPPVIEAVNMVFGNAAALATVAPAATCERWMHGWNTHTTHFDKRPGFAALLRPAAVSTETEEGDAVNVATATATNTIECELAPAVAVLREIRAAERCLTVAFLLRKNDEVSAAVDFLRRQHGLPPVVSETDAAVAVDNPVTLALLSLLRTAAHPGDSMAWEHVRMTPLSALWDGGGWSRGRLVRHTLQAILGDGFEAWIRFWSRRIEPGLARDDVFARMRLGQLAELARSFDARGSRDIDEFLRVVEASTARESALPGAIQVMTIHKAKGLDFDVVFLPRLRSKSFHDDSRQPLLRARDEDFSTRWLLRRPPGILTEADDVLREAQAASQAAYAYEGLCSLYVAMTRARHALYIIGAKGAGDGEARNARALIDRALAPDGDEPEPLFADGREWECGWCAGDARWFESVKIREPQPAVAASEPGGGVFVPAKAGVRRRARLTPSGRETHVLTAGQLFSTAGTPARELGVLAHAMFEQVADPDDRAALDAWWAALSPEPDEARHEAWSQVRACLDDPSVAAALRVPAGWTLWREKRFEIILDDGWVTGTFDRVIVGPSEAVIVDFKTDDVADEAAARARAAGYRPQVKLYRDVVSRLTGLPPESIRASLVFTRIRLVLAVD